ncbi:putative glutamine transport system permease protein [Streptococcus pneumoniae]|nr:putative glutamine transport system permease protein [Streptococcus pneumoniae]
MIKFDNIQIKYGDFVAIDNLNLDIHEGEFFTPNHSYLSQLDVTYKTPDLMSHFLPPHEVSFTFCCSSIVFPR